MRWGQDGFEIDEEGVMPDIQTCSESEHESSGSSEGERELLSKTQRAELKRQVDIAYKKDLGTINSSDSNGDENDIDGELQCDGVLPFITDIVSAGTAWIDEFWKMATPMF